MTSESYRHSVHIAAEPEQVFEYFTRPESIVRWMGDYAVLDPRPDGEFTLDINGVPVRGRYLAAEEALTQLGPLRLRHAAAGREHGRDHADPR